MNILLSTLLTLAPVWNLRLDPIYISPGLQDTLNLPASVDDRYLVLNFQDAHSLSVFKQDCLTLTDRLEGMDDLLSKNRSLLELKDDALEEKQVEISLLREKNSYLEQALREYQDKPSWNVYTIILGTALAGTLTYIMIR